MNRYLFKTIWATNTTWNVAAGAIATYTETNATYSHTIFDFLSPFLPITFSFHFNVQFFLLFRVIARRSKPISSFSCFLRTKNTFNLFLCASDIGQCHSVGTTLFHAVFCWFKPFFVHLKSWIINSEKTQAVQYYCSRFSGHKTFRADCTQQTESWLIIRGTRVAVNLWFKKFRIYVFSHSIIMRYSKKIPIDGNFFVNFSSKRNQWMHSENRQAEQLRETELNLSFHKYVRICAENFIAI